MTSDVCPPMSRIELYCDDSHQEVHIGFLVRSGELHYENWLPEGPHVQIQTADDVDLVDVEHADYAVGYKRYVIRCPMPSCPQCVSAGDRLGGHTESLGFNAARALWGANRDESPVFRRIEAAGEKAYATAERLTTFAHSGVRRMSLKVLNMVLGM